MCGQVYVPAGGQLKVPIPRSPCLPRVQAPGGDGGGTTQSPPTAREPLLKSARERMDIIAAYREAGTYRGAAQIAGTTHKTVRRVIARQEAGGAAPGHRGQYSPGRRGHVLRRPAQPDRGRGPGRLP